MLRLLDRGTTFFSVVALLCLAPPRPAEAGEIQVRFCYWANYKDSDMFRRLCEGFEQANPGIKIRREWYVGDYGRKLQLVLITNRAADIILMDDEVYPAYSVRGYLEDLTPYILRESDDLERDLAADLRFITTPEEERDPDYEQHFFPTSMESFRYRGIQGGLPWDGNVVVMYYNKDLFDREGIPYPSRDWTWQEHREIAKKLSKDLDGDGRNDQFGSSGDFSFLGIEPLLWSFGGDVLNADRTRCTLNSPRAQEAAQFLYDMKYKDLSIAWAAQVGGMGLEVQILTGRVAMAPGGSYAIPMFGRAEGGMRWDIAHMPIGPYGDRYTRVTWDGISINAHTTTEKKEIAWKFIKYLLSDEWQTRIGELQRGLPIRREIAMKTYANPQTPVREEIAIEALEYGRLTPITARYQDLRDTMTADFNALNSAEATGAKPLEVLARLEPKVNRVLEKELEDFSENFKGTLRTSAYGGSVLKAVGIALGLVGLAVSACFSAPCVRKRFRERLREAAHMFRSKMLRLEACEGLLFASPWLCGFCVFTAFPIVFSIVLSFSEWDPYLPIAQMKFIGLDNFRRAFSADNVTGDPLVRKALYNTFSYAIVVVPLVLSTSLGLALLLNQRIRGITIFRTTFYLPSIVSGVATTILWMYIFNPLFGPLNAGIRALNRLLDQTDLLAFVNLPEPEWLNSPVWAKPSLVLMSLWGAGGGGMLIFLAGLQGVPDHLYEVADLDGAGRLRKFWNITLPMLTPTIYFNFVMGLIGALQVFMQAFIMTNGTGGVDNSLLFHVLHLYKKGFIEYEMGYAASLAWILFVIILTLTLLVIKSSALWVYYEGEQGGRG